MLVIVLASVATRYWHIDCSSADMSASATSVALLYHIPTDDVGSDYLVKAFVCLCPVGAWYTSPT